MTIKNDLILAKEWTVMSLKMIIGAAKDEESGFLPCLATRTKQNTGNYFNILVKQ